MCEMLALETKQSGGKLFPHSVIERKIKGEMKVTGRRGRRRRKLLDGHKERRG
jgi:hypothetical protein